VYEQPDANRRAIALLRTDGSFPPAYKVDQQGKPIHSWRTCFLPHLERDDLYNAYDFTEPWDAPKNKSVSRERMAMYQCPSDSSTAREASAARTNYFAVVGPNAAWSDSRPRKLADFGKDRAHTILLVEVGDSDVAWAEPIDFSLDALGVVTKSRTLPLTSNHRPPEDFFFTYGATGVHVALADGSVAFLRTDNLSAEELRKILQIGGCTDEVLAAQGNLYSGRRLNWPNIAALAVWLVSVGTLLTAAVRGRKPRSVKALATVQS
jgi:hypothetical protein